MKKFNFLLTILVILTFPTVSLAGPWKISVNTNLEFAKKAYLVSVISPGFEKVLDSADLEKGTCTFSRGNDDIQLHVFRLAIDQGTFKPTFFAANGDQLMIEFTSADAAKLSGNKAAAYYAMYQEIQERETSDQHAVMSEIRQIGIDSAQLKVLNTIAKNKLAASANEKIKLVQSIDDPVLSAYLAYEEVFASKTENIELYQKYHDALGSRAQQNLWAKYVQDVVQNFEAYQLLRQSKLIKPDQLKAKYESLPEAQKKSGFGQDLARELAAMK